MTRLHTHRAGRPRLQPWSLSQVNVAGATNSPKPRSRPSEKANTACAASGITALAATPEIEDLQYRLAAASVTSVPRRRGHQGAETSVVARSRRCPAAAEPETTESFSAADQGAVIRLHLDGHCCFQRCGLYVSRCSTEEHRFFQWSDETRDRRHVAHRTSGTSPSQKSKGVCQRPSSTRPLHRSGFRRRDRDGHQGRCRHQHTGRHPAGPDRLACDGRDLANALAYPPKDFVGVMDAAIKLHSAHDRLIESGVIRLEWVQKNEEPFTPRLDSFKPPPAVHSLDFDEIAFLENFLKHGDIASARLLLKRAANAGNAQAAFALGATFDPVFLAEGGWPGFAPDEALARTWYKRAIELGSTEASRRLEHLAIMGR